jgi:DNA polymerase III subunit beta
MAIYRGEKITNENVIVADNFVRGILKIKPDGKLRVRIADGAIMVRSDSVKVTSKLIEANFPNYKQNIPWPNEGKNVFSCRCDEMRDALKTCSIFSDAKSVEMEGAGKEIKFTHEDKAKVMVLGTELAGQPKLKMRFNPTYILDVVSVLQQDNVRIQCTDALSPMVVEEGAFKAVIMILRQD